MLYFDFRYNEQQSNGGGTVGYIITVIVITTGSVEVRTRAHPFSKHSNRGSNRLQVYIYLPLHRPIYVRVRV